MSKPPSLGVDTGHSVRTALVFVVEFAAVMCPCDTVLGIRVDAGHSGRAVDPARRPVIDPQHVTEERRFTPPWTVEEYRGRLS